DLYFRLALLEIAMPRLTERIEDLPLLENFFLDKFSNVYETPRQRLSRRVQMLLAKHTWPGNIRELENVITYCCIMSRNEVIEAVDLPAYLHSAPMLPETSDQRLSMETMRLQYVKTVLERAGGNQ